METSEVGEVERIVGIHLIEVVGRVCKGKVIHLEKLRWPGPFEMEKAGTAPAARCDESRNERSGQSI